MVPPGAAVGLCLGVHGPIRDNAYRLLSIATVLTGQGKRGVVDVVPCGCGAMQVVVAAFGRKKKAMHTRGRLGPVNQEDGGRRDE
jgi:hypothetical protein